jgi:hypothetical protein
MIVTRLVRKAHKTLVMLRYATVLRKESQAKGNASASEK